MSSRLQKVHELFQTEMNKNHVVYTQKLDINTGRPKFNYNPLGYVLTSWEYHAEEKLFRCYHF